MANPRQVRTLQRAVDIAGGDEELAKLLRTSPEVLSKWLSGEMAPPSRINLAAIDVVSRASKDHEPKSAFRPSRGSAKAKSDQHSSDGSGRALSFAETVGVILAAITAVGLIMVALIALSKIGS